MNQICEFDLICILFALWFFLSVLFIFSYSVGRYISDHRTQIGGLSLQFKIQTISGTALLIIGVLMIMKLFDLDQTMMNGIAVVSLGVAIISFAMSELRTRN